MSKNTITTEASYVKAMAQACSPEDWQAIVSKMVELAKAGDLKAAAFLAKYLLKEAPQLVTIRAWQASGHNPIKEALRKQKDHEGLLAAFGHGVDDKELDRLLASLLEEGDGSDSSGQ